ncbi:hypothetical protein [Nocardia stercoris]|uniref:Uncharacterized protein n=1 Tax=Nocardia stercoris TaxID=2483361 RepID=A0A3M2KQY3_9NOCA|nr:hypothetical protein [Nocardia stercoris]RMI28032.1 hypothetical protein EBN03_31700 [Nocardia stercoris]
MWKPAPIFHGEFEAELTTQPADADRLAEFAAERGLEFARIMLDRGRVPDEPMLIWSATGDFTAVRESIFALVADVRAIGISLARIKIGATPQTVGVPESEAAARELGQLYYFEHHIELLLPGTTEADGLADLAMAHTAHLSTDTRKLRTDGQIERIVTQRCRFVGDDVAAARCAALVAALRAQHYQVTSVERKFVVHDSTPSVDDGWIKEKPDAVLESATIHRWNIRNGTGSLTRADGSPAWFHLADVALRDVLELREGDRVDALIQYGREAGYPRPAESVRRQDVADRPVALDYLRFEFTNFSEYDGGVFAHDCQWVHTKHFRLQSEAIADRMILAALIAHPQFGDDYLGPDSAAKSKSLHGKWWRHRIGPDTYQQVDVDRAIEVFDEWAGDVDEMPARFRERLEAHVYAPTRTATSHYVLGPLSPDAVHDYGDVHVGFCELVLIDRAAETVTLLVGTDD